MKSKPLYEKGSARKAQLANDFYHSAVNIAMFSIGSDLLGLRPPFLLPRGLGIKHIEFYMISEQ